MHSLAVCLWPFVQLPCQTELCVALCVACLYRLESQECNVHRVSQTVQKELRQRLTKTPGALSGPSRYIHVVVSGLQRINA